MPYPKQTWTDWSSGTPTADQVVNAARLGHIEDGVEAAASVADAAATPDDIAAVSATDAAYTDQQVAALELSVAQMLGRPSRPANLTVTALGTTTATLVWDASTPPPGGSTTNYRVFKNGVVVAASVGTTVTTYTVTGLSASTSYDFYVVPSNTTGDGLQSITVTGTTPTAAVPTVPTGLQAPSWSDVRVDLAWTASTSPSGPVTGYKVFRGGSQIGTTTALTYVDTGRTPSTAYVYTVKASNAAGDSVASDPSTVTTLATSPVPGVRGTFSAVPTTTTQPFTATLPPGILAGEVGYVMLTDNNGTDTPTSVTSPSGAWVLRSGPVVSGVSTQRAWLYRKDSMSTADAGGTITVTLTGGTRFGCVGIVLSKATAADDALVSWATTPTGSTAFDIAAITPTVNNTRLVMLSLARFTQTTANQYNLPADWTTPVNVRSGHSTSPQVGGLVAHQALGAAGVAHGPQGASDGASFADLASEIAFEITVAPAVALTPSVPRNLRVTANAAPSITYAWDAPVPVAAAVTNYKLYDGTGAVLATVAASQLTYTRSSLTAGQTVGFHVSAINSVGEGTATSDLSTVVLGTTASRFPGDPGVGKMMMGQASSEMTCAAFDKRVFPGATANDPPVHRFKLDRSYNATSAFLLDTARKSDLTANSAAGRITVLSWKGEAAHSYTDILAGGADADITANATFLRNLGTPVWWCYHHEPDNDMMVSGGIPYSSITAAMKTKVQNYRDAFRYQINMIRGIASNVAFFSPFYVGGIWDDVQGTSHDWRWYHPNFTGDPMAGGTWLNNGPFGGSWVNGDGIDMYNPLLGGKLTSSSRNASWEAKAQSFLTRRTATGGRELPWVIGELGTYNWLDTLDDNGVTNQSQDHDMITIGAVSEGLVGVCFWNNAYAGFNDANDLYPTVGARTAALRTEINANLSTVVMG